MNAAKTRHAQGLQNRLGTDSAEFTCLPKLSSRELGWDHVQVEQFQHPPGECRIASEAEHTVCLSLATRPVRFLQIKDGKTHSSLYGKGDISITPAQTSFFARWQDDDHYVELRLDSGFMATIAQESLGLNPNRIELIPEFRLRDGRLEAIALMLLDELNQANPGGKLYVESLTNLLAVHLLRQYAVARPPLPIHPSGLPQRQLLPVLDHIHEALDADLKLADLAAIAGLSPFHFSHQFKQAMGMAPYQYVLQQRVERAKQLLKQTNHSIVEIALLCGFNSHSHLSKQFRQTTGTTPSAYRAIVQ
ncbi:MULTISPECIES: helix-turn-helix domain-containing protein [Cyanophyceae]|uniref:AraC family transcriptional regulator n=1 Tax=Leptolyngbya subtilissima DQ-A4 TaxID=2933933 RepID=A0ABV0K4R0_9CYAN|nr:AraC family transcriptional regulator [Nodosilinea sp. FACHB-141]MBD2112717.1 helix-turn-helix transcriptional regulator [Nodosilinea sp. FACHB-141]